ncbi:MAG: hypothetical protein MUE42_03880, partial [Opitutaceae bacterium]|nr:hypothetical protein [Opitutaceae bacterium]
MALKKIRFVWPTPPLPEGRWRLGLFHYAQSIDPARPLPAGGVPAYWKGYLHHTLTFSLRGLLVWGALLAVATYFAGAGLLYLRHERANPHNRVGYWDLALPHRWSERPRLQGEGFILLARDKLAEGRFQEGFALLRLGVERAPRNAAARLDLARLFVALRLRPQAEKLLHDGLAHGYPGREFLEFTFALAAEGDQPDAWLSLCQLARQSLDSTPDAPASEQAWLDRQLVRALITDGRLGEAAAHLGTRYPESDPFRREITLLDLLEKGDAATAAALATRWAEEQPRSPEPLRLLVRALRESGDFAAMDSALARLRALDPARPDALLYAITQNHAAGRPEAARFAHQALIFRHGASPAIHATLAAVYAELGLRHEIIAMQDELRSRGLPAAGILIPLLQAD